MPAVRGRPHRQSGERDTPDTSDPPDRPSSRDISAGNEPISYPAPEWQAELGDLWVEDATFLWLEVPSAIVPEEHNVLLNPQHHRMADVRTLGTRPFRFDRRLA
jgi:RES domain-containing protein